MRESSVMLAGPWTARAAGSRPLRALASLKLTLVVIALLGSGLVAVQALDAEATWPVAVPLLLFAANLSAAVATNGVFRRQAPLLVFHLALIGAVLLVAAGRLTYLRGEAEVSVGAAFEGRLATQRTGPLHAGRIDQVRFVNDGYTIDYGPGMRRNETRNAVRWSENGAWRRAVIGDQEPLVIGGYRFYTSHNKGFAPLLRWRAADGRRYRGTVHLPSYPAHSLGQAQEWTPPGAASAVWIMLDMEAPVYDEGAAWAFRLPSSHRLIVRSGEERHELAPGARVAIAGGELEYESLTTWMGYSVFYDPTLPWLLAACVLAVVSLGWHYWRKFRAQPWDA